MLRLALSSAAILIVTVSAAAADPLACMPDSVRVIAVVDHPRKVAEIVTHLEAFEQAQTLAQYKQLYDSPTVRQLLKLLAFAEKELGAEWPDLLDQLAGAGIAVGIQFGNNAPALAVVCGTDAKQAERAFDFGIRTLNEEMARQGGKDAVKVERDGDAVIVQFGDFHFARIRSTFLASNNADHLKKALELARRTPKDKIPPHKARRDMAKILPRDPLAWVWVDFAAIKESKEAKDFFDATRQDFIQTLGAGSTIDCLRRSEFVALGLYQEANAYRLRVRFPAGREGMWTDLALHVPPKGAPGSLPLLDPPGTIYSQSFYLDLGYMWKNRERMITGDAKKDFEKAEKQISRFIPGDFKLGELVQMWGPYHRIVVANHDRRPYKTEPGLKLPAFGYVATMRDPKFGENIGPVLQGAALVGTLQFGMKSAEVQHEGVALMSYRFPENKELAEDTANIRYNFEPCFAIVGDEVVIASTVELGKKLIAELKKPRPKSSPSLWQGKAAAAAATYVLGGGEPDTLITDAVLGRGVSLSQARQEVDQLTTWIGTLGSARIELDMTSTEYRLDVVWTPEMGKK